MWGEIVKGFSWMEIKDVGGGVESFYPIGWRKTSLNQQCTEDVVD